MTKAVSSVVPRVKAYGIGDVNRLKPYVFEGEVGQEIENLGTRKPLEVLHKETGALRDQRFFYESGLKPKAGFPVPDEVKGPGIVVYDLFQQRGQGTATDDACDYDNGDKSLRKDGYVSVRWIVHPERFENGQAVLGERSEVYHILVPFAEKDELRWVLMTDDGMYRPDTGSPFALGTREQAVKSMIKRDIPEELAENEASRFWSRSEDSGVAAVDRWSGECDGPFYVYADGSPRYRYDGLGSIRVSRSASGASSDSETGVKVVTEEEYRAFEADRKRLAEREENLATLKAELRRLSE